MEEKKIAGYIEAWKKGNELAFNFILDYYYPRLLTAALKIIPVREDAEELVMNAFLKLWQYQKRMDSVLKFDNYLFGILRQEIARLSRQKWISTVSLNEVPLPALGATDHQEITAGELHRQYQAALKKLTPKQREIFLLSRDEELSHQQISDRAGLSVHTINNHLTTALKIMKEEISGDVLWFIFLTHLFTIPF